MAWLCGTLTLVIVGLALRFILRMGRLSAHPLENSSSLRPECQGIYPRVARELETQSAMLAISLNDAFQERNARRDEIAWRLVHLAVSEWDRLAENVETLLTVLTKHRARAESVVPHSIVARSFKSPLMIDYVRLHELLDQLVFHSKLRFKLQIRLLTRATETLTSEFRRTFRYLEQTQDPSPEVWKRLDLYFHDFDLVTKEALLALRAFLAVLPPSAVTDLLPILQGVVERGVCSTNVRPIR